MPSDVMKEEVQKQYAKIALSGNSEYCCMPREYSDGKVSSLQAAKMLGYDPRDLDLIPASSILGVGCGVPLNFSQITEGETVVDLGSGAGIDVFLAAIRVGKHGKVIGVDLTDEMLDRARKNAAEHGYTNVEFRKGDIEKTIPVKDNSADLVISNCVINLTSVKSDAFHEAYRILKKGGRMVISDLVADREVRHELANAEKWCRCIDGALTRENYLASMKKAGFEDIEILSERLYVEGGQADGRKITSIVIKAVK